MDELERIKQAYRKRATPSVAERYSIFRPGELYMQHSRERLILDLLRKVGLNSLSGHRILEIGCGRGQRLADFQRWGAEPEMIHGIELVSSFVSKAQERYPAYRLAQASAHRLPFLDGVFDIVAQFTVFTSIRDDALRSAIAAEMLRVLRPGGLVLWYDFRYPNPWNSDVRPVSASEIRRLFAGCALAIRSVTLLPPAARRIAGTSHALCNVLEALPFLRSHYMVLIRKTRAGHMGA